jgi:hypothetical protein
VKIVFDFRSADHFRGVKYREPCQSSRRHKQNLGFVVVNGGVTVFLAMPDGSVIHSMYISIINKYIQY